MACVSVVSVTMYNPEHHQSSSFMAPRMSFSSDFALEPPPSSAPRAPGDADFEFSVGSRPMMAADELFSKGRLLPLREAGPSHGGRPPPSTLRDELRADDRHGRAPRRWKELLGFKKAPKKAPPADTGAGTSSSAETNLDLGGQGGTRE